MQMPKESSELDLAGSDSTGLREGLCDLCIVITSCQQLLLVVVMFHVRHHRIAKANIDRFISVSVVEFTD